ncbi:MAG: hypothetical protein ACJ762_03665 [Solirubrobacteraceae bacterium]
MSAPDLRLVAQSPEPVDGPRLLRVATPVGPLRLDIGGDLTGDLVLLSAHGVLMLPSGPLEVRLANLATIDIANRTVSWTKQRLRRSIRLAVGPWTALRIIPVLLPRLERVMTASEPLAAYAGLRLPQLLREQERHLRERIALLEQPAVRLAAERTTA